MSRKKRVVVRGAMRRSISEAAIRPRRQPKRNQRGPNVREGIAEALAGKRGYEVLRSGWPDMLLWRESDQKAVFVEVKKKPYRVGAEEPGVTTLRPNQARMHAVLKKLGLDVQIFWVD